MNREEFQNIIFKSRFADEAIKTSINIGIADTLFETKIQGIIQLYDIIKDNLSKWKKEAIFLRSRLINIIASFTKLSEYFDNHFEDDFNSEEYYSFDDWKQSFIDQFNEKLLYLISHDHPASVFIMEKALKANDEFDGAFDYLTRQSFVSIGSAEYFNGVLSAMLFEQGDLSEKRNNQDAELSWMVLEKQRDEFRQLISNIKIDFNANNTTFNNWKNDIENQFSSFYLSSENEVKKLKKIYSETMKLKEPAAHWATRARKLRRQGRWSMAGLIFSVLIALASVFALLWLTPEGVLLNFIDDKASAVKWSIIYITFISFQVFILRVLHRVVFSSFHLARDAEEREQLTYVYLSLKHETDITESDRILVLQSIFARADTGLLKDDTSPTMPGGVVDKLMQK